MIFVYNNHEFEVNWIWSDVLRPQDRFMEHDYRQNGVRRGCVLSDAVLLVRLHQALAWETQVEMAEPEWPSAYWDSVSDYRNEMECNRECGIRTETPLAPIYAYLFS